MVTIFANKQNGDETCAKLGLRGRYLRKSARRRRSWRYSTSGRRSAGVQVESIPRGPRHRCTTPHNPLRRRRPVPHRIRLGRRWLAVELRLCKRRRNTFILIFTASLKQNITRLSLRGKNEDKICLLTVTGTANDRGSFDQPKSDLGWRHKPMITPEARRDVLT